MPEILARLLVHGHGNVGVNDTADVRQRRMIVHLLADFGLAAEKDKIDLFVFGHSHIAVDQEINGKIYFNPGSPTDTIFTPKRSYGIIEINGKKITRRIIYLE